jgi:light-regulated signal transduction histidine kinase (bacteriophytochrome)
MDVQMPDLNGFETATIIYERDKLRNIPIIFITAFGYDEDYIFKGYKTGGVDYIYKPVNPEVLRMKVSVFVDLYRKNQQLILHERRLMTANKSLQKEIEERKISEEKIRQLNEQLVQNNAHLKAVNEELDRFAYVASHDLQEPLRKILVFSDKISMKNTFDNETENYFKKIVASSKRMQVLINDLLSLSRDATSSPDFGAVDLNAILKEIVTELDVQIEKNHAQVHIGKLPVLNAIPSLMRQLFHNLINNAIKFRKDAVDPVICIESRIRIDSNGTSDKNYYNIIVSDNGIGFDPKYKDEIFLVFKRLHSDHEFEGSGVGLSICKKIVEKHNGSIAAESTPGEGSTFIIELPEVQ